MGTTRHIIQALLSILLIASCTPGGGENDQPEVEAPSPSEDTEASNEAREIEADDVPVDDEPTAETEESTDSTPPRVRDDGTISFETRLILAAEEIPAPFVADLLTRPDVRSVFGYDGELSEADLPGRPTTPYYQALRLAPTEGFGFSVELELASSRSRAMNIQREISSSWLQSEREPRIANSSIGSSLGVRSIAFASPATNFVAIISCDVELCSDDQLVEMARIVRDRVETRE